MMIIIIIIIIYLQDSGGDLSRYGLHASLLKPPQPTSRHDLLAWDYLNARTISSARHKNPRRGLENNLKLGLMDVVRQVR